MSLLSGNTIGIENLLDDVEKVIMGSINDSLAFVYTARAPQDEERAAQRGEVYLKIEYDQVAPNHIYVGWVPSFVDQEVSLESYPYLAFTWENYMPDPEDAGQDHRTVTRQALTIHALVTATQKEGPEIAFRRAVRMSEAVFISLASDPSMQKKLSGLSNPTSAQPSVPFVTQYNGHGDKFWFQAVGTSYAVKSYSSQYD